MGKVIRMVISLGKPGQRIFVERNGEEYATPFWITKRGNLAWKIYDQLYVKNREGKVFMLKGGKWVPGDTKTDAKAPDPSPDESSYGQRDMEL